MVGGENKDENAASASAAENQITIYIKDPSIRNAQTVPFAFLNVLEGGQPKTGQSRARSSGPDRFCLR